MWPIKGNQLRWKARRAWAGGGWRHDNHFPVFSVSQWLWECNVWCNCYVLVGGCHYQGNLTAPPSPLPYPWHPQDTTPVTHYMLATTESTLELSLNSTGSFPLVINRGPRLHLWEIRHLIKTREYRFTCSFRYETPWSLTLEALIVQCSYGQGKSWHLKPFWKIMEKSWILVFFQEDVQNWYFHEKVMEFFINRQFHAPYMARK